jgi:hypothetical protein
MAATLLSDIIVPEVFNQYVVSRTAELSAFWQSGIVGELPEVAALMGGGKTVNMPFWQDLSGADEVIDDTTDLTINKIDTEQDEAVICIRGKAWGASDLSAMLAGSDPMMAIGDLVAGYWSRRMQTALLSVVKGAFSTTVSGGSMASATLNISALSPTTLRVFTPEGLLDACQLLGDAQDALAGLAIHSATYNLMLKDDLIDFVKPSDGGDAIPTYLGKRVIVDDSMPKTSAGVYTSYIFGPGAIGYAEGSPKTPTETERKALIGGGTDVLVNRRKFILHPRGVRWIGNVSPTPTNTHLETGTNWSRVWEQKQVRMVRFIHKVA